MKKFYTIPYHERYYMNSEGYVFDTALKTLINPFVIDNLYYFNLDNENIEAGKLSLQTFIGSFPSNIIYKLGWKNFDIKSVKYDIHNIIFNENSIDIEGINFVALNKYPNYYISRSGIVYSQYYRKFLCRSFNDKGYPTVSLIDNTGHRSPRKIHRLVYETFIGELDDEKVIDHVNGKKWCCEDWNLDQISQRENVMRAYDNGQNPCNHWTDDQIHTICKMIENNSSINDIIQELGLDEDDKRNISMIIHLIRKKNYFKEISKNYNIDGYCTSINKGSRVLTIEDVINIKNILKSGSLSIKKISEKFKCSTSTITKIRDGKTWKNVG